MATTAKPKLTLTERKLIEMLTENTGRSMLDSGSAYGRNWECNQARNFKDEPHATLAIRPCDWQDEKAEIEVTLNLFHWLLERVDYDPTMTARFTRFSQRKENKEIPYLELMEEFAKDIRNGAGLCGEGNPMTVNTYNGEDLLSQTIQYIYWTEYGGSQEYILLQIHGGCDVRGGYTAPKVFQVSTDEYSILDNARASIAETLPATAKDQVALPGMETVGHVDVPYWDTDDGCHWRRDGKALETYEVSTDPADKGNGKIYVDDDGVAYGPIYGGKLEVYAS